MPPRLGLPFWRSRGARAFVPSGASFSADARSHSAPSAAAISEIALPHPGRHARHVAGHPRTSRRAYGAPGALAVVRLGAHRTFLASGPADDERDPHLRGTRFRVASITKPIVAALVVDAVARGELALDDEVGELMPAVLRRSRR